MTNERMTFEFMTNERMIERMTFTVHDENGMEIECEVLFTFESEETGKNYIVYTDNTRDENGNIKVYASIYDPTAEKPELLPIETAHEWEMVGAMLQEVQQDVKEEINQIIDEDGNEE